MEGAATKQLAARLRESVERAVGRKRRTLVSVTVESDGISTKVFAPKGTLELPPQFVGFGEKVRGPVGISEPVRASSRHAQRRIDVALHLYEGDRALCEFAVRMENSVVRILPALVGKSLL